MTYEEYVCYARAVHRITWWLLDMERPLVAYWWVGHVEDGMPLYKILNAKPNAIYHRWPV